jgi:hypothetical protein
MTLREFLARKLLGCGLWSEEVHAVLDSVQADEDLFLAGFLDTATEGMESILLAAAWVATRFAALEWIDEHKPKHFAQYALDPERRMIE